MKNHQKDWPFPKRGIFSKNLPKNAGKQKNQKTLALKSQIIPSTLLKKNICKVQAVLTNSENELLTYKTVLMMAG